jgi:hypothetical protein
MKILKYKLILVFYLINYIPLEDICVCDFFSYQVLNLKKMNRSNKKDIFVDATANEECIAVLKTALSEQEETMEHQDMLIQQHEKNIDKAQKGTCHFCHTTCYLIWTLAMR